MECWASPGVVRARPGGFRLRLEASPVSAKETTRDTVGRWTAVAQRKGGARGTGSLYFHIDYIPRVAPLRSYPVSHG